MAVSKSFLALSPFLVIILFLFLAVVAGLCVGMTPPKNFAQLECAVNSFGLEFASARVPSSRLNFVKDALNIDLLCPRHIAQRLPKREWLGAYKPHNATLAVHDFIAEQMGKAGEMPPASSTIARESAPSSKVFSDATISANSPSSDIIFFVAPTGNDNNPGTLAQPFATLHRAQAATRAAGCTSTSPCIVSVRGGKYFLADEGGTLNLTPEDNNVIYSSFNGEEVVLSGATRLSSLQWGPYPAVPGAFMAPVRIRDARAEEWRAARRLRKGVDRVAGPPPLVGDLFVDGVRQVRARYPNGNIQHGTGLCFSATQRPGEGCSSYSTCARGTSGSQPAPPGMPIHITEPNRGNSPTQGCVQCADNYATFQYTIYPPPPDHPVYNKPLPSSLWTNNSVWDFWGSLFSRPADVHVSTTCDKMWGELDLQNATDAVVHMFHSGLWGGWAFAVDEIVAHPSKEQIQIKFGYGGYQEARGGGINNGQHFYLENALPLLDTGSEWLYDDVAGMLYFFPNVSTTPLPLSTHEFAVPVLDAIVRITGTDAALGTPARNITLHGFSFTESRYTYLEQYEVPSGGDWSIHRGGAVFVENAEGINITGNLFNQTGGNGIFLSNHVAHSVISDNELVFLGDSGIALQGSAVLNDGSLPIFPRDNIIAQNHIHEYGLYGKQTSCVYLSLVANNTIENNVCYNGPRAHINSNDGFAGGNLVKGNLLFNAVRETGDHGNYNSWDRQPYWTHSGVDDGFKDSRGRSYIKAIDTVAQNFIINGYNGVWTIDHDDGRWAWGGGIL